MPGGVPGGRDHRPVVRAIEQVVVLAVGRSDPGLADRLTDAVGHVPAESVGSAGDGGSTSTTPKSFIAATVVVWILS
ncbi:hypothetical protein GCM10028775_46600 [Catellatospora paridis]